MEIQFVPRRELNPSALQTFAVCCETHTEGIIHCAAKLRSSFDFKVIIIIIIESIVPSRDMGCLWVLSTSVYRLLRTLVHSSFYPLPWLPIFSSYFSVFLSSCSPEGSKVGQPRVSFHPLSLMRDQSIWIFFFLFLHLYLLVLLLSIGLCWK